MALLAPLEAVTAASALFLFLALVTGVLTSLHQEAEAELRNHHQTEAEEAFLSQPNRHPHRMIHYGHYVFRSPPPLQRLILESIRNRNRRFS